jgi:hypothetical protein
MQPKTLLVQAWIGNWLLNLWCTNNHVLKQIISFLQKIGVSSFLLENCKLWQPVVLVSSNVWLWVGHESYHNLV